MISSKTMLSNTGCFIRVVRCWQLRVGALRGRKKRPLRYRHIVIDEIQDFSPIEVQLLTGCLDRNRSITLAGDAQQRIVSGSGFTTWSELLDRLGLEGTSIETLQISYRCSREILEFGLSILGDLREDDSAPLAVRSGPPVDLFRFTEAGASVAFLSEALRRLVGNEPMASVALLCPDRETTSLYYGGLMESDVPGVRRVEAQDFTFQPGIEVTEIDQVKGLEFDYVILVGVDADHFPDDAESRRLLHVGATRAIHQLWLVSVDPPSPLLEGLAG